MMIDIKALSAQFDPDKIDWRVGSVTKDKTRGMALAYIDARTVQDRLDDVCGPFWQCRHEVAPDGKKTTCHIGIKIDDEWIWRSDGAGETDFEGEKGGYSDSFKRAAVRWGIGRYLYDLSSPWVALKDGRYILESEMPKLRAVLTNAAPVATPNKDLTEKLKASVADGAAKDKRRFDTPATNEQFNDKRFHGLTNDKEESVDLFKVIQGKPYWSRVAVKAVAAPLFKSLDDADDSSSLEAVLASSENLIRLEVCEHAVKAWFLEFHRRFKEKREELEKSEREFNPNRLLAG